MTIGSSSAGRVSISSFNLMKSFDACSPALFNAVNRGVEFTGITVTQRNDDGDPVTIVTLEKVFVESWQVSSSTAEAAATESVSVAAQKFCLTDVASGNKFCFDVGLNK